MPLLHLAIGWLLLAGDPAPALPGGARSSGSASDLTDLARLAPRDRAGPQGDSRPGSASQGRPAPAGETEPAEYVVESAARGTLVFLLPPGPRTVRALEIRPGPATAGAWRDARLRLTWEDDDPDPARAGVDLPIGVAFGRVEGFSPPESVALGTSGGSWVNRFPMPYRTVALLRIDTERPIEGRIVVRTTRGAAADAGYFRGAVRATGSLATKWTPGKVGETGRGQLVGVFRVTEGGSVRDRTRDQGRLVVDGRPLGPFDDALGLGRPGAGVTRPGRRSSSSPVVGFLETEPAAGGASNRAAGYGWFLADPVVFDRSFAVEPGVDVARDREEVGAAGTVAAFFWYSDRPAPGRGGR